MRLTSAKIGVLMGGWSPERPVSLKTGQAIYEALRHLRYRVVPIDVDHMLPWTLRAKKIEVAFLALHGPGGEDGVVQGCLETLGIPYTGSDVRASAIAMDKPKTKMILAHDGIPVAKGQVLSSKEKQSSRPKDLGLPLVVKPAAQGSTIGVSIVRRQADWKKALQRAYRQGEEVLVEAYIPGREIGVSVLNGRALPSVEILVPGGFYDYAAKYEKGGTRYQCPAVLSEAQTKKLGDLAERSWSALGCEGAVRVDFRVTPKGKPYVLEINTIPGMTQRSLLPMAAAQAGMDYGGLTEAILESALRRWSAKNADGRDRRTRMRRS
jgi:D-alanine-D-alanine ligase